MAVSCEIEHVAENEKDVGPVPDRKTGGGEKMDSLAAQLGGLRLKVCMVCSMGAAAHSADRDARPAFARGHKDAVLWPVRSVHR